MPETKNTDTDALLQQLSEQAEKPNSDIISGELRTIKNRILQLLNEHKEDPDKTALYQALDEPTSTDARKHITKTNDGTGYTIEIEEYGSTIPRLEATAEVITYINSQTDAFHNEINQCLQQALDKLAPNKASEERPDTTEAKHDTEKKSEKEPETLPELIEALKNQPNDKTDELMNGLKPVLNKLLALIPLSKKPNTDKIKFESIRDGKRDGKNKLQLSEENIKTPADFVSVIEFVISQPEINEKSKGKIAEVLRETIKPEVSDSTPQVTSTDSGDEKVQIEKQSFGQWIKGQSKWFVDTFINIGSESYWLKP